MDNFEQLIVDNIKQEPELIIEENNEEQDLSAADDKSDQLACINSLIDEKKKCIYCNKEFSTVEIMKAHQKFHHFDSIYRCHLCSFKTKYYSNLGKHIDSIHLKAHHYKCPVCSKKFKDQSNKNRHVRTIHKKSVHYCSVCHAKFTRKDNINLHMKRFHKSA